MKAITKPAFLTAFLLLLPNFAHPASIGAIGASLLGDSPGGTATWLLARADLAGVVPQTNWNNIDCNVTNIPPYVGISGPLIDYAGNMSAVQLQFVANDAWNGNGSAATPNDKLMKGVLKQTAGSSMTRSEKPDFLTSEIHLGQILPTNLPARFRRTRFDPAQKPIFGQMRHSPSGSGQDLL